MYTLFQLCHPLTKAFRAPRSRYTSRLWIHPSDEVLFHWISSKKDYSVFWQLWELSKVLGCQVGTVEWMVNELQFPLFQKTAVILFRRYSMEQDLAKRMNSEPSSIPASGCSECFIKCMAQLEKCVHFGGEYVEGVWSSIGFYLYYFLFYYPVARTFWTPLVI